jgi:transposase
MYKKEKNKTRANRINGSTGLTNHVILLLYKGYSGVEISNILNIDEDTIAKWKLRYLNRVDEESWLEDSYQPYVGKLSYRFVSLLRKYVGTFLVSDKKRLASFIEQSFSVSYTPSGLNKLLHRIGLSYQTIHKLPGNCPIERQQAWMVAEPVEVSKPLKKSCKRWIFLRKLFSSWTVYILLITAFIQRFGLK